ncbi:MAG: hypothetical protein LAQ69_35950 [Acidobacteriia bacterium]|nr:hypothetical protein [Terriglobia bacterium]
MKTNVSISRLLVRATVVFAAIGTIGWLSAASTAIGMAVANGSFQVDHSQVWGNSTLFDGSTIETAMATSQLQLNGGVQMRLASNTRVTVYQRRLVLESGFGQLESAAGYEVEARSLRISTVAPDTVARIRLEGDRKVTVAAIRGAVRVNNAVGLLVANVEAGHSLDLEPQVPGAAAPTRASGCLLAKGGKVVLAEQTANVILELHGTGLEQELGNRVEITGIAEEAAATVAGASQLIKVAGFRQISKGGCASIAKKLGATTAAAGAGAAGAGAAGAGAAGAGAAGAGAAAAGAAGAATATGIGIGTVAVIGGVATAATVGGLAAAGSLPGQGSSTPSASR